MSVKQCMDAIDERITRIAELTEIALARADALAERDKYFEQVKMLDKKVHNQREEINRLIAERDRRIAELKTDLQLEVRLSNEGSARERALQHRLMELERTVALYAEEIEKDSAEFKRRDRVLEDAAENMQRVTAERDALQRRIAELERALRAISDEAREGYYDGPGLQRFVEIRGLAEDALAPVGGASDVEEGE